jgi:hypothetical protein
MAKPDILAYGKQHIAKLESAGQVGNAIVYSCVVNKLKAYAKSDTLAFEQVTYLYIEQFNTVLLASGMKVMESPTTCELFGHCLTRQ